jgi:hypothetical protein
MLLRSDLAPVSFDITSPISLRRSRSLLFSQHILTSTSCNVSTVVISSVLSCTCTCKLAYIRMIWNLSLTALGSIIGRGHLYSWAHHDRGARGTIPKYTRVQDFPIHAAGSCIQLSISNDVFLCGQLRSTPATTRKHPTGCRTVCHGRSLLPRHTKSTKYANEISMGIVQVWYLTWNLPSPSTLRYLTLARREAKARLWSLNPKSFFPCLIDLPLVNMTSIERSKTAPSSLIPYWQDELTVNIMDVSVDPILLWSGQLS